jgi:hypothetical protein
MDYYLASLAGAALVCLFVITVTLLAHVTRHWDGDA